MPRNYNGAFLFAQRGENLISGTIEISQIEQEENELQEPIELTRPEKGQIMDATRESHTHLVKLIRAQPNSKEILTLFNEHDFLALEIRNAVYGSGIVSKLTRNNLLEAAQKVADLLGLTIHPIGSHGYSMNREESQNKRLDDEAEQGRKFAPEFVGSLGDTANQTLRGYLKSNQAPKQVIDLLDDAIMLERVEQELRHDHLNDWDAGWLTESIPEITQRIAELGGIFHGGGSISISREPIQWPGKQAKEGE
jgi:hypothetical protein